MRIHELLEQKENREIITTDPNQSLLAMAGMLLKNRIGALLVTNDQEKLIGIITERDIVSALVKMADKVTTCSVGYVMTRSVITCKPEDDVLETLAIMNEKKFRHMPVLRDGKPVAMLSIREFDAACRHLNSLSRTDELTGLANRRHFMEVLSAEFKRHDRLQTPLCVAMLDIDKFKAINDTYGHDAGDEVLRRLADIINGRLRSYDVVGRLGGEEFALMFPETSLDDAIAVCQNLGDRIRECEVETDSGVIRFTASFGVTEVVSEPDACDEVLMRADKLLYRAKADGRDRVVSDTRRSLHPLQPQPHQNLGYDEPAEIKKTGS